MKPIVPGIIIFHRYRGYGVLTKVNLLTSWVAARFDSVKLGARLEFAGTGYHVTAREDSCEAIFLDDEDRQAWLSVLSLVCERCNWVRIALMLLLWQKLRPISTCMS